MNAAHKPGKPTKAELAAHDEAVATAGSKTAPQAIGPGFGGNKGKDQRLMALKSAIHQKS